MFGYSRRPELRNKQSVGCNPSAKRIIKSLMTSIEYTLFDPFAIMMLRSIPN